MKTKILLAVTALMTFAVYATAEERIPDSGAPGNGIGSQQVVVNNYYYGNGYEYSSRLKRFHNSYASFDFYSPVYTEAFWYNFTPYTWGVSIYDDWYYYGAGVSRYSWRSGFGGSYWWGYDPWMDYDPWMGYGWNSWYSPGFSYGINIYLGRPQYHYPVAWNRWNYHQHWDSYRPVYIVNNNHYNTYVNTNSYSRNYNPSRTATTDRRSGYTVVSGRSTHGTDAGTGTTRSTGTGISGTGRTQGTRSATGTPGNGRSQGTRAGSGTTESRGNNAGQNEGDKEKSNNGLRMGQYRRGVAVPDEAKPNEPARTNNPNVNDRTDPGKEKSGAGKEKQTEMRAPVPAQSRQQTQGTVKTTTRRNETTVNQGSPTGTTRAGETTVTKSTEKRSTESAESKTSKTESGRRSTTSAKKR
jgi:hypothetical protein